MFCIAPGLIFMVHLNLGPRIPLGRLWPSDDNAVGGDDDYNGNNDDDPDDSCLNPPGLLPHILVAVSAPPLLDICSSSQETSPAFQLLWHIVSFAFFIGKEKNVTIIIFLVC